MAQRASCSAQLVAWSDSSESQCTAYFSQYFRVYSPIAFGKKWDKHGDYVRKYVPEVKDFPDKYIYSVRSLSSPGELR